MTDLDELIAEARESFSDATSGGDFDDWETLGRIVPRLADALEATTRVPVQGEPNDDREALNHIRVTAKANARWRRLANKTIRDAEAERDAALAAIERVRAIHLPVALETKTVCNSCDEEWPCDTREALDGAPEPEWEREYRRVRPDGVPVSNAVFETMPMLDDYCTAEYRTVSPWLPVEGESKP